MLKAFRRVFGGRVSSALQEDLGELKKLREANTFPRGILHSSRGEYLSVYFGYGPDESTFYPKDLHDIPYWALAMFRASDSVAYTNFCDLAAGSSTN